MMIARLWVLGALMLGSRTVVAQQPNEVGDVGSSYARARALLDSAIAAHGGLEIIRDARLTVRFEGVDVRRNQSVAAEPPYDREPATGELKVDLPRSRYVYTNTFRYAGGFRNANRVVIDGA